jgi:CHASE1-domain containing sensor protein
MKKLAITALTIVVLSTSALAQTADKESTKKMRMEFMQMTEQLIEAQMSMLSNYQKILKRMMIEEGAER